MATSRTPHRRSLPLAVEWAFAACVVLGTVWSVIHAVRFGYLPQPFLYDLADPFMDLYSVAYWSHQPGAYSVWNSVYPPLSFVVLKVLSPASCYAADGFWGRDCDPGLRYVLYAAFAANLVLLYRVFRRSDRGSAIPRTIALGAGLPMLYALDRGNLIIFTITAVVLAFTPVLRHARWRAWALAVAINFKPYLLALALPAIATRRWRWVVTLGIAGLAVYAASYFAFGAGTPGELLANSGTWVSETGENFWEKIYLSTSFAPLIRFATSDFPLLQYVDSRVVDRLVFVFTWTMRLALLAAAVVYALAALAPRRIAPRRLAALTICLLLVSSESSGGYALVFPLFLVLVERWPGRGGAIVLVCAYLLCIPADWSFLTVFRGTMQAWWTGREVSAEFGVAVGQFARPALLVVMLFVMSWMCASEWVRRGRRRSPAASSPDPLAPRPANA
jgi:hypothetical protein